jgi:hypothetical protein
MLNFNDEFKKYIKFNSKLNIWSINDEDGEVISIDHPKFVMDLKRLKTAWLYFREGQAPSVFLDESASPAPEPEGGNHRRGFVVETYSTVLGLREFSSCSLNLKKAMKLLYSDYEKEKDQHPDQLPVVQATGYIEAPSNYGMNYQPVFAIVGWTPRPPELGGVQGGTSSAGNPPPATEVNVEAPQADMIDDVVPY